MATMVQAVRMALHYGETHLGVTDSPRVRLPVRDPDVRASRVTRFWAGSHHRSPGSPNDRDPDADRVVVTRKHTRIRQRRHANAWSARQGVAGSASCGRAANVCPARQRV